MDSLLKFLNAISPLKQESTRSLVEIFQECQLEKGAFFIEEGRYARHIGFLETGIVRAFFTSGEDKEYNKQFFVGPALVGAYTSLLTGQENRVAQQALTDCRIWRAPFSEVEQLFDRHHDLERLGRKIAELYFLEKEKKELDMAMLSLPQRYLVFREEFPGLEMEIPQYHVASYLGITPTQLSRIRKKMAGGHPS